MTENRYRHFRFLTMCNTAQREEAGEEEEDGERQEVGVERGAGWWRVRTCNRT